MNFIGKEIDDFKVNAFQNGEVKPVAKQDLLGHWSIVFFYPADFSFVCPTELGDLADNYAAFKKKLAQRFILFLKIRNLYTKLGMNKVKRLVKSSTQCWQIQLVS